MANFANIREALEYSKQVFDNTDDDRYYDAALGELARLETEFEEIVTQRDHLYNQEWPWEWVVATKEKERRQAAEAQVATLRDALTKIIVAHDDAGDEPDIEDIRAALKAGA